MLNWGLKDQTSYISHPLCFLIPNDCNVSSCSLLWIGNVDPNSSRANLTPHCAETGDTGAFSLTDGEISVGMGGAGIVGGVGVGMVTDTAGLDTEAPGTCPRGSPLPLLLVGVSSDVLGATAPMGE